MKTEIEQLVNQFSMKLFFILSLFIIPAIILKSTGKLTGDLTQMPSFQLMIVAGIIYMSTLNYKSLKAGTR